MSTSDATTIESSNNLQTSLLDDEDTEFETPRETPEFSDDTGTTINVDDDDGETFNIEVVESDENLDADAEADAKAKAKAKEDADAKAAAAAKSDGDAASVAELENVSEGVRKRIDRLTYEKREAERANNELIELSKKLLLRTGELEKQQKLSNVAQYDSLKTAIEAREQNAIQALTTAHEESDPAKIAKATAVLSEVSAQKAALLQRAPVRTADKPAASTTATTDKPATPTTSNEPHIEPRTTQWLRDNDWFQKAGEEDRTDFAFGVSATLVKRGVKEGSEEYFQEIDRRLKETFPSKFSAMKTDANTADETEQKGQGAKPAATHRPPVGAVRSSASGEPRTVRLTRSQMSIAAALGLTPQQYAKQLSKESS